MRVFVHLGSNWKNNVEGLCGNYDGRQDNEFNGAKTAVEFGNNWKTKTLCPDVPSLDPHKLAPCYVSWINLRQNR